MKLPELTKVLAKNKYALLLLCLGLALLLLPRRSGSAVSAASAPSAAAAEGDPMEASGIPLDTESERIGELLRAVQGVGEAEVLLSSRGCVVVCSGADSPAVRLDVTNAVAAYTGLGTDKIRVFKMR